MNDDMNRPGQLALFDAPRDTKTLIEMLDILRHDAHLRATSICASNGWHSEGDYADVELFDLGDGEMRVNAGFVYGMEVAIRVLRGETSLGTGEDSLLVMDEEELLAMVEEEGDEFDLDECETFTLTEALARRSKGA